MAESPQFLTPQRTIVLLCVGVMGVSTLLIQLPPPPPPVAPVRRAAAPATGVVVPSSPTSPAAAVPAPRTKETVSTAGTLALPALVFDVHNPAGLRNAWNQNAWAGDLRKSSLGQGLLGSWAPLLGSRGEDLQADLKGLLSDALLDRVLTAPFQVAYFKGSSADGRPAVILPAAPRAAFQALDALDVVAGADVEVLQCPPLAKEEEEEAPDGGALDAGTPHDAGVGAAGPFHLRRYAIAERGFVAARQGETLVLAGTTAAVVNALCSPVPPMNTRAGVDLDVTLLGEHLGRDAEALLALLGVQGPVRLGFGVQASSLSPRGISTLLGGQTILTSGPAQPVTMKAIPHDVGVAALFNVMLPAVLDDASLDEAFAGKVVAGSLARQVTFLMEPSGTGDGPVEAALLWSRVEDLDRLKAIFSGPGGVMVEASCGLVVITTTAAFAQRISATCEGKTPSMSHAAAPVVAGFAVPSSITLLLQPGAMLSRLTQDGYRKAGKDPSTPSTPVKDAVTLLQTLPPLGFQGRVEGTTVVAQGFRP